MKIIAVRLLFGNRGWPVCLGAALALLFGAVSSTPAATTLVPKAAGWRYLDDGSNQQTAWKELYYDDDLWKFGRAELGYGDAPKGRPEATVIGFGPNPSQRYLTTYFRRYFFVQDAGAISNLTVRLLRDDGGVVYLNGVEVFRSGMPSGPVAYNTLASQPGAADAEETTYFSANVNPRTLFTGINLVAVEIHQSQPDSDDLSFDLELAANEPALPVTLARTPYLQSGSSTNLILRWRTVEPVESRVSFGLTLNNLKWNAWEPNAKTEHALVLTNLAPDTKYYYSIGSSTTNLAAGSDYYFISAPTQARPIRVWAIGDAGSAFNQPDYSGIGVIENQRGARDAYYAFSANRHTDVWLLLGDNAYNNGTDGDYETNFFRIYPELIRRTVVWPAIGNHEAQAPLGEAVTYLQMFSLPTRGEAGGVPSGDEHYYSFDYGNIHFICLDSEISNRALDGPMLTWLQADLAENNKDWLIAYWHSPPYSRGSHNSDSSFDSGGRLEQMRQRVVPILENYGVDLVLSGHSHSYERSYLLNGHYGNSSTLVPSMILDGGSGQPEDSGAYLKFDTGPAPLQGAVYVVAGSSGWAWPASLNHPAMFISLQKVGTLVVDINGNRLDAQFLRDTGVIDDHFTIIKGVAPEPLRFASLRVSGGQLIARWKSTAGATYRIDSSPSLDHPVWSPLSPNITATSVTTSWTNPVPAGSPNRYFRVVRVN